MRIVVLDQWLSKKMGYSTGFYAKALAEQGHDVHLVTSNAQVYFNFPEYKSIYEKFIGPGVVDCCVEPWNGFTLHRLPYKIWPRRSVGIKGLIGKLKEIKPDIVHVTDIGTEIAYEAALAKHIQGFKFFTECHAHASVFPPFVQKIKTPWRWLYWHLYRPLAGKIVSSAAEKCWAIGDDVAEIARDYLGFPENKIGRMTLGTDTRMFFPWYEASQDQRQEFRAQLGFDKENIVCIYTGRMHDGKDPLILARAIDRLIKGGKPFRGIFIGDGAFEYMDQLKKNAGCVLLTFVAVDQLPQYYQAADIGVWPKQESTSQLDASSCGLPLVLSDRIKVHERVEGNGLLYQENNLEDLIAQLSKLQDAPGRRRMGEHGVAKIRKNYSWENIAKSLVSEYEKALKK